MATELDYCEYTTDALAQANWVHNTTDVADSPYTKLLIHFDGADGATVIPTATGQVVSTYGTVQLDTAQKKFGSASLLLDGDSDYISVPYSANWGYITSSTIKIDAQVRFNDATGKQVICGQYLDADNYWEFFKNVTTHKLEYVVRSAATTYIDRVMASNWAVNETNWFHIQLELSSSNSKIFIDGVAQTISGIALTSGNYTFPSSPLYIGANNGNYFNGWIDEFRLRQANLAISSNFTAPTYAYTPIQSFTNTSSTYKVEGTYSLKLRNFYGSGSLSVTGKTFTKTLSNINLSSLNRLNVWTRYGGTTAVHTIGLHDSGGTTSTFNLYDGTNILDLTTISENNRDAIDSIILTYTATPSGADDVYFDNIYAYSTENTQIVIL